MKKSIFIILLIIIADQILKIWIKTHLLIGQSISIITDRIQILFVENNGMAFGMQFAGSYGKILLTLIRITAIIVLFVYLYKLIKRNKAPLGLVIAFSLIIAGALGNVIDCLFYGMIFDASTPYHIAQLFPAQGGYSSFLQGKVVDMFYCPVIRGYFPDWLPIKGGDSFTFFAPIFNIADSAITVGIFWMIIGFKKFFKK